MTLRQIRAALSFAFKCWDQPNPFCKIDPPIAEEPQIRYLTQTEVRRLLLHLRAVQKGYGATLSYHLANALFQTACRYSELANVRWTDCLMAGEAVVAIRIKGKGSRFQDVPVPKALSFELAEWKKEQERTKEKRIFSATGVAFAASSYVFASYSGAPFTNRAFNLRLRSACRHLGIPVITAHGLRHSAATLLLHHSRKDLREIQELLRHKNIRTTVRYTHVTFEQTRQTAEALSGILD